MMRIVMLRYTQIRFLGGKLGQALADEYSAATVSDLLYVFWRILRYTLQPH
jgi:hypothetical protein